MLKATTASITEGLTCTHLSAAAAKVMLCATVNAVMVLISVRRDLTNSNKPSTKLK